MKTEQVPLTAFTSVANAAILTSYKAINRAKKYWFPVIYPFGKFHYKAKKFAAPKENFFDKIGDYIFFYNGDGVFYGIGREVDLEPVSVASVRKENLMVGSLLFGKEAVHSLKIVEGNLFINGKSFEEVIADHQSGAE